MACHKWKGELRMWFQVGVQKGHYYMKSLPQESEKRELVLMKEANDSEMKALEAFIWMKKRCTVLGT